MSALEVDSNYDGSSTEDEMEERRSFEFKAPPPVVRKTFNLLLATGVAVLINLGAYAAVKGPVANGGFQGLTKVLTVRSLLEGPEFRELATDNLMALGQGSLSSIGRVEVREHVSRSVSNISSAIRRLYPDDHERMGSIELTGAQRDSVLRVLQKYGDVRMVHLTGAIQDAARETAQSHGDKSELKRRLSEKLGPHIGEMEQLAKEMFPDSHNSFALDLDSLHIVHKWHPTLEVDFSNPEGTRSLLRGRRLSSEGLSGIDSGVRAQAATLLESLEHELGERMPKAPVRLLTATSQDKDQSLMQCLSAAVTKANPTGVFKCMTDNIQDVISMMMRYVKGQS